MSAVAPLLQAFFTERLQKEREASQDTVDAYKYAFSLLLRFVQSRDGKAPSTLVLDDLDAPMISAFLDHLEQVRKNCPKTRNARLAAIRSFFGYISVLVPERADLIQRVLAIPQKRFDRNLIDFLTRTEIEALLKAPDRATRIGRRDHALMLFAVQTGLRVSEIIGLRIEQITWGKNPFLRCHGKGRKERCVPLTRQTVKVLQAWLTERDGAPSDVLFPSIRGGGLSRDAVERLVTKHAAKAGNRCRSLTEKRVTPHVLRHTTAVQLLQGGVDIAVIALWLGHESIETTQIYLDADLEIKEKALARLTPLGTPQRRYQADDQLLAFLKGL